MNHVIMLSGGAGSALAAIRVVKQASRTNTSGTTSPLPLRAFRERHEQQPALIDPLDFGGCGCFVD